jgi:hypothetical protein
MKQFKTKKQFDLQKPLNHTLDGSWDKIEFWISWGNLARAFRWENNAVFIGNKLKSQEVYNDFSQFIKPNEEIKTTNRGWVKWKDITLQDNISLTWNQIMDRFSAAGKMFKGNSYRFQSQAAYQFLKKYIGTQELWTVRYSPNYIFPYEEFQNDKVTLGDQVELVVDKSNEQKIQQSTQQKDKSKIEQNLVVANETIQNLQTQLEREQNKSKFLEEQLEQQTQIVQPNPPAFEK